MFEGLLCDDFKNIDKSISLTEERFSKINSPKDFILTPDGLILLDAINMRLQVIVEGLNKIHKTNSEFLNKYSGVEWRKIIGLINIIYHHYDLVDYEVTYEICTTDLPKLKKSIKIILSDLKCE